MKKRVQKFATIMLAIILVIPMLSLGNVSIANAKEKQNNKILTPTLTITKKTLYENGETILVSVNNVGDNVKDITWYTQNKKVATVVKTNEPQSAIITSVKKGTTQVKCKITYENGTIIRPAIKITVKVKAVTINISNEKLNKNGFHVIEVGKKYNFNVKFTPTNSQYHTYWSISDTKVATVDSKGFVKGLTPGVVELTAIAAKSKEDALTSTIKDTVKIVIVDHISHEDAENDDDDDDHDSNTTEGIKLSLTEATKLVAVFENAIDKNTVIGANNVLLNSVVITPKADEKGVAANPVGTLTASLSEDGKVLTIQNSNIFSGVYNLHFTSLIKTKTGVAIPDYSKDYAIYDTKKPEYKGYTIDPTGLIVTFNFSEAMDFSTLLVADAKAVNTTQTLLPATTAILNEKLYYVASADKKSLTLNLSNIAVADQNKELSIKLYNLKDLANHFIETNPITVTFKTDTTLKPQAVLKSLERVDANTITATYDRPIKTPGTLIINAEYITGTVNLTNPMKVDYILTATSSQLTGYYEVRIGLWNSYNVLPGDISANDYIKLIIKF